MASAPTAAPTAEATATCRKVFGRPIEAPDPIEALKFHMEQNGLSQKDLTKVLNSAPRASEILNRQRRLNLDMVWKLSTAWRIPAESLIKPYELEDKSV